MVKKTRSLKAVTIIELIMVIMIVGILASVSSMYIKEVIDLWSFLSFRNEVVSRQRTALVRMVREIRQIKDVSSVNIAGVSQFKFVDMNNNTIDYYISGNNLMRAVNGSGNILTSSAVAPTFTFTYYNANNAVIATPLVSPSETDIHRIFVSLTIKSGKETKTLSAQVFPRNL